MEMVKKIQPPKSKLLPKSLVSDPARYKAYRDKRSAQDDEWNAFNRARSYLEKLNKTENRTRTNSLDRASDAMWEKHELYYNKGKYYSLIVDRYCIKHLKTAKHCRKN